jgi:hypothetical protein
MPAHSGRPAFLAITNVNTRIANHHRLRPCAFGDSTSKNQIRALLKRDPVEDCWQPKEGSLLSRHGFRFLRLGWPRCCRDWASLLAAEMRRTAAANGESQLAR